MIQSQPPNSLSLDAAKRLMKRITTDDSIGAGEHHYRGLCVIQLPDRIYREAATVYNDDGRCVAVLFGDSADDARQRAEFFVDAYNRPVREPKTELELIADAEDRAAALREER